MFLLHVADDELMDVVDGTARIRALTHVSRCTRCQVRVDEARGGLALAVEAGVPEPSPLYWDALRSRVGAGLADLPAAGAVRSRFRPVFAGALVAAGAALAGVMLLPIHSPMPSTNATVASSLPAWSALPEEDPNLEVLEGLETQVADIVPVTAECHDWAECVAGLDEAEGRALAVALRKELGAEGAL